MWGACRYSALETRQWATVRTFLFTLTDRGTGIMQLSYDCARELTRAAQLEYVELTRAAQLENVE